MPKEQNQSFKQVVKNNWFLFRICFQAAPLYLCAYIFEAIRNQICIFLEHTYGIGYVLEAAENKYPFADVAKFLIFLFAITVASMISSSILWARWEPKGKAHILKQFKMKLYERAAIMDLDCYDNPEYYNEFVLSIAEAENQVNRMLTLIVQLFGGVTTLVSTGIFFLVKDKTSVIFVSISFVGSVLLSKKLNQINYNLRLSRNPLERKASYINRIFYLSDYAKEHRLNPEISDDLVHMFEDTTKEIERVYRQNALKRFLICFGRSYICNDFIPNILFMLYLVYKAAVLHSIPYATVIILYNSSGRLKRGLRIFTEVYPYACENSLYIKKIRKFLSDNPKIVSLKHRHLPKEPKAIELKNVSFAYNEISGNVIEHMDLVIHPYEKIALVGYNGAGKTTLTKLLMRLYDPTEGEILYDGINIKEYDLKEYRSHIGAVFQDYIMFGATLKENVGLDEAQYIDSEKAKVALVESGFGERINSLAEGMNTNITTEFSESGVNLSGGESQKVAVARVFYQDSDFMILDEPSSALDPIAEYQLNHSMMIAANQKTVIFISHRLSTTRLANRIIMLEQGKVIEAGTHEELLQKREKYYEMWKAQAGQYISVDA